MTDEHREAKRLKKALQTLTDTVLLGLDALDNAVAGRHDLPSDLSHWLGRWATTLDMANDHHQYPDRERSSTPRRPVLGRGHEV